MRAQIAVPVLVVMAVCVFAGWALKSDYNAAGVVAIFVGWLVQLYLPRMAGVSMRTARLMAVVGIVIPLLMLSEVEAIGFLALLPVAFYNGGKDRKSVASNHGGKACDTAAFYRVGKERNRGGLASGIQKWFFYAFYPGHLLLLAGIRHMIM